MNNNNNTYDRYSTKNINVLGTRKNMAKLRSRKKSRAHKDDLL